MSIVQSKEISLASLLRFDPEKGQIRLQDYRMVMLSATALGCLRKDLIETLGWDKARALMKRFGYAAGLADALALAQRFASATGKQHLEYGLTLHSLEGVALIVRDESKSKIDLERGHFHDEGYWENSYEAEQHLELVGRSDAPVCWTLVGYATGHLASVTGRNTIVVETECKAMGYDRCRFVAGFADEMAEAARHENPDYDPHHLPKILGDLKATIRKQQRKLQTKERTISLLESELEEQRREGLLLGASASMKKTLDLARLVAPVNTTVLLVGESGTGKELLARWIHDASPRSKRPFIAVNCSTLPENLQEAELFGFVRGAFTGSVADSQGLFEAADTGTLFLDEIGDLSLSAQTKILRALQEGEIKRLGETRVRKINVRVLAATNRNLEVMVRDRTFRDDLYYRLSVVTIELPPLRDREDDALLLAERFVNNYSRQFSKTMRGLSQCATCAIAAYQWPGNVRELQNAIQRAVIVAQGDKVELEDLPEAARLGGRLLPGLVTPKSASISAWTDGEPPFHETEDERSKVRRALAVAEGNRAKAASMLAMSRTTLWRRMKALEIPADSADK